jgi:hypothetical protein
MAGLLGEGIDFRGGMLDWEEDDSGHRVAILRNYAVIILPQVTISARNIVLNVELQEIYAEGDVVFDQPSGNSFYCDQLTFNYQEWTGLAENVRVKMDRGQVTLPVRDFLDEAPSTAMTRPTSLGTSQTNGPIRRIFVQARELRSHDRDTFELIDAKITPDSFARPKWYFRSPAALLRRGEKIESYHNTVNIGRLPILYFPYIIRDLQYDWPWMRLTAGHSSDLGYFIRTQWGWRLNNNPSSYLRLERMILDLDYFTKRGFGTGLELAYSMGHLDSLGKLKVYGVYEHAISKGEDYKRATNDNLDRIYTGQPGYTPSFYRKDFRWEVDWEHQQQLNESWDIRGELSLFHDRDYLKEFNENRFWNEKEPENFIDLRRQDKNWQLEIVAQSRLSNRWETRTAYYPELRVTVPGIQLLNLPIFVKDDFTMGVVDHYYDTDATRFGGDAIWGLDAWGRANSKLWNKDHYGATFRATNQLTVEAPIKVAEAFTLKPWVGLGTAYYSHSLGGVMPDSQLAQYDKDLRYNTGSAAALYNYKRFSPGQLRGRGDDEYQAYVPFGVDLSTRFYTIFGASDQWRLTTESTVSYLENTNAHLDYERDLYPFDERDVYNPQRRFGYELHNKLQRRYYELADGDKIPTRDILDFNLRFYYYPRERDRNKLNFGTQGYGHHLTEVETDFTYRPITNFTLSANFLLDTHDDTVNRAIMSADWRLSSIFRLVATHYHYRGDYWRYPDSPYSEQSYLALRTKLWNDSSHYAVETAVGFEWRETDASRGVKHGFNQYRLTLFRDLDTFEMSISYVNKRTTSDHGVYFTLSPKNFMGMERPGPVYSAAVEELAEGRYQNAFTSFGNPIDPPVTDADLKDVQF